MAKIVQAVGAERPRDVWLALDMSNAFGRVRRDKVLEAIDGKVEGGKEKNPGITETKPAGKIQQTPFAELPQAENIPVVKTNN